MDDWDISLTAEEKDRAVNAILDRGLSELERSRFRWGRLLRAVSPGTLFFGVEDCVFLALLVAALCAIPLCSVAVNQQGALPALLFLLSPALYVALYALTGWKERMTGTWEWKQTCRVSLRELTALRMLVFGGVSVVVCVPVSALLWRLTGGALSLPWLMGLSVSSLFLFAALSLLCQRSRRRWVRLAPPALWLAFSLIAAVWEWAREALLTVPVWTFFLVCVGSVIFYLWELKRQLLQPVEGGVSYAVG